MSEFKGTPGPWHVDEESFMVVNKFSDFVAEFDNGRWGEDHANADLIAAAPKLLRALQCAIYHLREQAKIDAHAAGVLNAANAAIAKALGG